MVVAQAIKALGFAGSFVRYVSICYWGRGFFFRKLILGLLQSLYVLVNNTATNVGQSNAGVVNGLGQALENVGRLLAPGLMGAFYAWACRQPVISRFFLHHSLTTLTGLNSFLPIHLLLMDCWLL